MGYNIAIKDTECKAALCYKAKNNIVRIYVGDKLTDMQSSDLIVDLKTAKKAISDWDKFISRNRLSAETDMIYISKVKNEDDLKVLKPLQKNVPSGWVDTKGLSASDLKKVLDAGDKENAVTEWQETDFDVVNQTCAKCPLSWNKGRNCLEAFGPSNSLLPEIASKAGCKIVASVPESAEKMKVFSPKDAKTLLEEVKKLRPALEADSKMAVRRYSGVLDRLESLAKVCSENDCSFYFF